MARVLALILGLFATAACGQQTGEDPVGKKMLLDGAREGDPRKVQAALDRGVWVDDPDPEFEQTALHLAAKAGYVDTVQVLLDARADVNARTHHDETALMEAADNGHDKTVELLIKFEADVNARTHSGKTALHGASVTGHGEIVHMLLAAGAESKPMDSGRYPDEMMSRHLPPHTKEALKKKRDEL